MASHCKPTSSCPGRSHLRFATSGQLNSPRTKTDYGKRSFAVNGPVVWNSLPTELRSPDISLDVFKAKLKTFLFNCWLTAFGVFILILRTTNVLNNNKNNNLSLTFDERDVLARRADAVCSDEYVIMEHLWKNFFDFQLQNSLITPLSPSTSTLTITEVTSVQHIRPFSLTASLTIFVPSPWSRLCCIRLSKCIIITLHYTIINSITVNLNLTIFAEQTWSDQRVTSTLCCKISESRELIVPKLLLVYQFSWNYSMSRVVVKERIFCFPPHLNAVLTLLRKIINKIIHSDKHQVTLPIRKKTTTYKLLHQEFRMT